MSTEATCKDLFPTRAAQRLYERGLEEQWSIAHDLDWNPLSLGELGRPVREAMATVYGQIHFGEVLGLAVTSRAVEQAPELWAKLFGATQLMDEARHVEFFSTILNALGHNATVLPELEALGADLRSVASTEEMMLGTHIILEGFAQRVFVDGAHKAKTALTVRIRLPGSLAAAGLMRHLGSHVGKDEGRHLAFGVMYLRHRFQRLPTSEARRLELRARSWGAMVAAMTSRLESSLRMLGTSASALRASVETAQRSQFRSIGFAP